MRLSAQIHRGARGIERLQPVNRMPQSAPVTGTRVLDFNAYIASGANPGLVAGRTVWFQLAAQNSVVAAADRFDLSAGPRFTLAP